MLRDLGSHNTGPEDSNLQRGRTGGETARYSGGLMGHGLLSLMAEREGIDYVLFHQAPPHMTPPLPTRPATELSTSNSYSEAHADEYSDLSLIHI